MDNNAPTSVSDGAPQTKKKTAPKRIIICCDGTWQSATSGKENVASNITQLARMLNHTYVDEDGNEGSQIVWYDSGIGTTSSWLGQKIEGAFGNGLEVKVIEAYQFIVMNYVDGDKIMCFGFSRGAYTARSIAGLISDVGICPRSKLGTFHELWEFYKWKGAKKSSDGEKFFKDIDWIDFIEGVEADLADQIPPEQIKDMYIDPTVYISKPHPEWEDSNIGQSWPREVEVVGVYDTVGALGFPKIFGYQLPFGPDKNGFHNVQLSPHIKHAFQALALDEHRESFSPTLWYLPPKRDPVLDSEFEEVRAKMDAAWDRWHEVRYDPKVSREERESSDRQRRHAREQFFRLEEANLPQPELIQVWFPGCHVNIGGGSSDTLKEEGDLEALSHLAYAWMLDRISDYVSLDRGAYQTETEAHYRGIKRLNLNAETAAAEVRAREEELAHQGRWARFSAGTRNLANKVLHPLTTAPSSTAKLHQLTWGLGDFSDSYTTLYALNGSWRRTPGNYTAKGHPPKLGVTNEFIHPSVGYRMSRTKGHSEAMKEYGPYQWKEGEFVRRAKVPGPGYEYIIKGSTKPVDEWKLPESSWEANNGGGFNFIKFERYVVFDDDAKKYVKELDDEYGYPEQVMGNWAVETETRRYISEEEAAALMERLRKEKEEYDREYGSSAEQEDASVD